MEATLSLAYRGSLDPDHILYGLLSGSSDTHQVRLRSRRPFVPAARNLLDNLARLGIRASESTNHKWKTEYCENASRLRAFVPGTGAWPVGMGLPRAAWVKLNRLRTGVGRFHSSMHKWSLAPSPNCECGAFEQTADHVEQSALYIGHHSRTSPKNLGGAMKFCPNFVTFAQIMILWYISDMTKKLSEILRQKPNFVLKSW